MEPTLEHLPSTLPLPFSAAVRAGSVLYLSGQLGIGAGSTKLVQGGIASETRQALENIEGVLLEAGSSKEKIVRCEVFLSDFADFMAMNEAYKDFFGPGPYPARTAVAVSGMALNAKIEIQATAVL